MKRMSLRIFLLTTITAFVLNANYSLANAGWEGDSSYQYTPPVGWTKTTQSEIDIYTSPLLPCTDHSVYSLYAFSLIESNASLQDLAAQFHKAFFRPSASFVYQDREKRMVKGVNSRNNEYLYFETPAQDIITVNQDHLYHYYIVYLERRSTKVAAFILSLNPYSYSVAARPIAVNGFFYECKSLAQVWENFIGSIRLPGTVSAVAVQAKELLGKWTSAVHTGWSGLAGNQYAVENRQMVESLELRADGRFVHALATKPPATGLFRLQGNSLSLKEDKGRTDVYSVSTQSIFEFGHWKTTLILTDKNNRTITFNQE